jgi:hypothetical protein
MYSNLFSRDRKIQNGLAGRGDGEGLHLSLALVEGVLVVVVLFDKDHEGAALHAHRGAEILPEMQIL